MREGRGEPMQQVEVALENVFLIPIPSNKNAFKASNQILTIFSGIIIYSHLLGTNELREQFSKQQQIKCISTRKKIQFPFKVHFLRNFLVLPNFIILKSPPPSPKCSPQHLQPLILLRHLEIVHHMGPVCKSSVLAGNVSDPGYGHLRVKRQ